MKRGAAARSASTTAGRYRPALSVAMFALVALLLPIGVLALWANSTLYDSETFATRTVDLLGASKARAEVADGITDRLVEAGYRPAVAFRPAFQFGVEVALDTEAFRSIFRSAIQRFHAALLAGQGGHGGLDLSDSLSLITSTVQLPGSAEQSGGDEALGRTLESVTAKASGLGVWEWEDLTSEVAVVALVLATGLSAAGIAVAVDRRRAITRLGLAVMASGLVVLALRALGVLAVRRLVPDPAVSDALGDGIWRVTEDVEVIGIWLLGYGAVVAAAVSERPFTPAGVARWAGGWVEQRRARGGGWLAVGVALIVAGLAVTAAPPAGLLRLAVYGGGLWLVYLGVHELVSHITARQAADGTVAPVRGERRRVLLAGGAVGAVLVGSTVAFLVTTQQARAEAEEAGTRRCNGDADLCSARLDQVSFPGTHNSMSASLYPGWLFGEHIPTISAQLDAGVRAFLIDTHYGAATNVRVPGTTAPLVVTDRAAELSAPPGGETDIDPATERRALALRQRAPRQADAQRQIYLCHNYCEMGAVRFSSVLADVRAFLQSHADDVVVLIIQDATTVADTVAAIEQAGLGQQAATLTKGQPLPTLGDLIDSDKQLLVFAEQGGDQAPPWYMKAYDWFQETGFAFASVDGFNCEPNRGLPSNPLFLLNHWVSRSPPDPAVAGRANARDVLEQRLRSCQEQRDLVPNVIAVDFASRGQLLAVTDALNERLRDRGPQGGPSSQGGGAPGTTAAPPTTAAPSPSAEDGSDLPDVVGPTPVATLTGGDPAVFCSSYSDTVAVLGAYAVAALSESPSAAGVADLTFGPVVARSLDSWTSSAPRELAAQVQTLRARAQAAVAALTGLGLPPSTVDQLAKDASSALSDAAADPLGTEHQLAGRLRSTVGEDRLAEAGRAFVAAEGDASAHLNLGDVPADVAREAGYDCLASA